MGAPLDGVLRRARGSAAARGALVRLGAGYARLVWATTRWRVEGYDEHAAPLVVGGGPFIVAFWHNRLFLAPLWRPKGRRSVALISNNRDGELIAAVCARLGVEAARGSTTNPLKGKKKGGGEAFAAGLEALRAGAVLGITPDGPRGPRMRAQTGVAALSAVSGAPVLPLAYATRRGRRAASWDRFLIPAPFGRGVVLYGAPIAAPASEGETAVEAHRRAIEAALTALTDRADALAGRAPVAPDPAPAT